MKKEKTKEVEVFKNISIWIFIGLIFISIGFVILERIGGKIAYSFIIYSLSIIITIFALIFLSSSIILLFIVKNKKVVFFKYSQIKLLIKLNYYFMIVIADIWKIDKRHIRRFFIKLNNIAVESLNLKVNVDDILILIPHCTQNSKCRIKLTEDIGLCQNCGLCNMNEIKKIKNEIGIKVSVVNGGTAARMRIKNIKPKFVLAIACERDLIDGIVDTGEQLYVYGFLNERPNGPCVDTTFDIKKFKKILMGFVSEKT